MAWSETGERTYGTAARAAELLVVVVEAGRAMTLRDLADRLDVHPRTVRRYAQALAEVYDVRGRPLVEVDHCVGREAVVRVRYFGRVVEDTGSTAA